MVIPEIPRQNLSQQALIAQVIAKTKAAQRSASAPTPVAAAPPAPAAPAAPAAAPSAPASKAPAEEKASQDKVKEMAQKLGIPFTQDLIALGTNAAISDALIEKAVAAGKSESQINEAMAAL